MHFSRNGLPLLNRWTDEPLIRDLIKGCYDRYVKDGEGDLENNLEIVETLFDVEEFTGNLFELALANNLRVTNVGRSFILQYAQSLVEQRMVFTTTMDTWNELLVSRQVDESFKAPVWNDREYDLIYEAKMIVDSNERSALLAFCDRLNLGEYLKFLVIWMG